MEVEFIQINPRLGAMAVLNGDVTFTTSFVSTFRGIVQGLPMKTVFILLKKGTYYLMVRPDIIKDIQDLKGKKLGVTAVNGGDHIIGRELLRMKGLDPNLVQAIAVGDPSLRFQAAVTGVVQAVSVPPPYDLMLEQKGLKAISGPPEIGVPSSGLFASDRSIKENPRGVAAHHPSDLEGESVYWREPRGNDPHHDQIRAAIGGDRGAILRY